MSVTIDVDKLVNQMKELFDVPELQAKVKALKGVEFNPFKFGPDGTPVGWDIFVQDTGMVTSIFLQVIKTAEKLTSEAGQVAAGKDKLDAVVKFLDDIIQLPFYLEWADGPALKMIITYLVNLLNKVLGKDWLSHIPSV